MNKKFEVFLDKFGTMISLWFILFGLILTILFVLIKPFNDWSFNPDPQLFSNYGDFIGGLVGPLFTLAGFLLIFKTFKAQQETLEKQDNLRKDQQKVFEQERFETTFFNLLKNQNQIINDFKVYFHSLKEVTTEVTNIVLGREFFLYSKRELLDIWNSFNSKKYAGYFDFENAQYTQIEIDELYNPNSPSFTHPDDAIDQETRMKYEIRLSQINKAYGIDGPVWDKFKKFDIEGKLKVIYGFYFQKYHYAAGHYFRHLYHILDFIEKSESKVVSLTSNPIEIESIKADFKKYALFVQAQMSSFELLLLFYNSFCFPKMLRLIKKYNILENLATEDLIDISHDFDKEILLKHRLKLMNI
jgi:hypothetical protein